MKIISFSFVAFSLFCTVGSQAAFTAKDFDPKVKPQDNFYTYVNSSWLKANPIPPQYSSWGVFNEVNERNIAAVHSILVSAASATNPDKITQQVGDFYASGMDEKSVETAGINPLKSELNSLSRLNSVSQVCESIAHLHSLGVNVGFGFGSEQDPKNSVMMIAGVSQAGLGLPDRDYYLKTDAASQKLREKYLGHINQILVLSGYSENDAKTASSNILTLETELAKISKSNVELRDPVSNYHKTLSSDLAKLTPDFDWNLYFSRTGLKNLDSIDVGQPDFLKGFDHLLTTIPLATWQAYMHWHLIHAYAPYLSSVFVNANFEFYGKTLSGAKELRERWKRVLSAEEGSIGENLGKAYVAKYFPPESKARVLSLVSNLRAVLRDEISHLEWMDAETRTKALVKLDAYGVKIGYPDKWIDYSSLTIDRGPYVLNVMRANTFNVSRDLAKVGHLKDRTEWGMIPPEVNAYYDPTMNEIVFPAGILQPPFFDPKADDAINYGSIGAVIGHEMTHGFDDEGRQFDPKGNLTDWWSASSAKLFQERASGIVHQFSGYSIASGQHVNGELTQGENIADLGGVKIAYAALEKALEGKPRTLIDGYTEEQRFFFSYALIWRENMRPEAMALQVNTDPHSPPEFRVNGPLSNLAQFWAAFNVPEGTPMHRTAKDNVTIW